MLKQLIIAIGLFFCATTNAQLGTPSYDASSESTIKQKAFEDSVTKSKKKLGFNIGKKWYFNYNILTPSGILYFDRGDDIKDSSGNELAPDFYKDGKGAFGVQVLSFDVLYGESFVRAGVTAGIGVSPTTDYGAAGYAVGNLGFAISFDQNVRFEIGESFGASPKESFTERWYDNAIYVGLTFPTALSENIKEKLHP